MAVIRSVLFYLLFIAAHLSTGSNGTSTSTPAVGTGSTSSVTTTPTMTATTKAMTTQSPVMTTIDSANVTTTIKPKTTGPPVTVVPPSTNVGNWTLKDDKGKICMRMSFAAQMNVSYTKNDKSTGTVIVNLSPILADIIATCKSGKPGRLLEVYPFSKKLDSGWTFTLSFKKSSGKYSLTEVGTSWVYDSRFVDSSLIGFSSSSVGVDNFLDQSVTLGKSYSCVKPLKVVTGASSLQLWDMNLQPFAEEAGGNFGEAEICHAAVSFTVVIAAVVGAFLLIGVITLVVVIVVKKRKRCGEDDEELCLLDVGRKP